MKERIKKIAKLKLYTSKNNNEKERFEIINKILLDDGCFNKMEAETAYKILYDLGFEEKEIKKIYNELIFNNIKS